MKRENQYLLGLALAGCVGVFLIYCGVQSRRTDRNPPVLQIPEAPLTVQVSAGTPELLEGITARDDRDGDVTDLVVLESVSHLHGDGSAQAVYAAFDRSGNVTKASRELIYTDYHPPRFYLSGPLLLWEGGGSHVMDRVGAQDCIDGNLNRHVKGLVVSGGESVDRPGSYEVEFRVTNSLGDTAHLTLPVEIRTGQMPEEVLELKQYLVYLRVGDDFDPLSYVEEEHRRSTVVKSSDVDTGKPGVYTVDYADQWGETYGMTRLIVVVEA